MEIGLLPIAKLCRPRYLPQLSCSLALCALEMGGLRFTGVGSVQEVVV